MNYKAGFAAEGTYTPDQLLAGNAHLLMAKTVTILSGQSLARGAVIGKITTSGKYKLSASDATDGSQAPDLVLAEDCAATGADRAALAYIRGDFNVNALTLGAGHTIASISEGLRTKGIALLPTITA